MFLHLLVRGSRVRLRTKVAGRYLEDYFPGFHVFPLGVSCFPFHFGFHVFPLGVSCFPKHDSSRAIPRRLLKGPEGTGFAVFLVGQSPQARRHTKLHCSSANSLLGFHVFPLGVSCFPYYSIVFNTMGEPREPSVRVSCFPSWGFMFSLFTLGFTC